MTVEDFLRKNIATPNHRLDWQERLGSTVHMLFTFPVFFLQGTGVVASFRTSSWGKKLRTLGFAIIMLFLTFPLAIGLENLLPNFFPTETWFQFIRLIVGYYLVGMVFGLILIVYLRFHPDDRRRQKIIRQYHARHPEGIHFSDTEYQSAATVLRSFRPMTFDEAVIKHGQNIIDLLLLAHGLTFSTETKTFWRNHTVLRRLVSIRAIETDTEAGADDDSE